MSNPTVSLGIESTLLETLFAGLDDPLNHYDVVIQFHSADNIPKMDVIGHADPYFVANIDEHVSLTSTIIPNTAAPVWENERWIVRNIPLTAQLSVKVFDKDDDKLGDDYIGEFQVLNLINYHAPPDGHEIIGSFGRQHGYFHLSIQSMRSSEETKSLPPYTFDGPCRYSRHDSLAVGRLTMLSSDSIYSTWKIQIRRISAYFRPHERQHWNKKYAAAQSIFGDCALALATQSTIKIAHKILYGRTLKNNDNGLLNDADDVWKIVFTDRTTQRIKPCMYTYVIDETTWRFSETDGQFFADYASKHALLANVSEYVRYAGEFHPRPKNGWEHWNDDDEWELVFDNGSGTYSPDPDLLVNLKELLSFNFPGLNIVTYDFEDPELKESMRHLKHARKRYYNSTDTIGGLVLGYSGASESKSC